MEFKSNSQIILFNTPFWDIYSPFSAVPYLIGALHEKGHSAIQFDLNIIHFHRQFEKYKDLILNNMLCEEYFNAMTYDIKMRIGCNTYFEYKSKLNDINTEIASVNQVKECYKTFDFHHLNLLDIFIDTLFKAELPDGYMSQINKISFERVIECCNADDLLDTVEFSGALQQIEGNPLLVGFSITSDRQLPAALFYAKLIREKSPSTKLVFGGSFISSFLHLADDEKIKELFGIADFLGYGEGETFICKLVEAINNGGACYQIVPNLVYINKSNEVVRTMLLLEDAETLPMPNFDLLDLKLYIAPEIMLPYQTSRGCFWGQCGFCNHDENYRLNHRVKSIEKSIREITLLKEKYKFKHLQFIDEAIKPSYFVDFVNAIDGNNIMDGVQWIYYSKVSNVYTDEIVGKAYKNGCRMVFFGIETFSERLSKLIRKGISIKTAIENLKIFSKYGIKTFVWMLCNLPSQTVDEIIRDIEVIHENRNHISTIGLGDFYIDKNCDMHRQPEKFNIIEFDKENNYIFKSHNNGEIIRQEDIFDIHIRYYRPMLTKNFISVNRFSVYFYRMYKEQYQRQPVLIQEGNLYKIISDSMNNELSQKNKSIIWLKTQLENYISLYESQEKTIDELRKWASSLEEGKSWLEGQWKNYMELAENQKAEIEKLRRKCNNKE